MAESDNIVRLAELQDLTPWLPQCVLGETGKPLAVLANALAAMRAVMQVFSPTTRCCVCRC
jgi:hypothetical protein